MSLELWESRSLLVDLEAERRNQERLELLAQAVNERSPEKLLEILRSMGTAAHVYIQMAVRRLPANTFGRCVPSAFAGLAGTLAEDAEQNLLAALFMLVHKFSCDRDIEEWDDSIPTMIEVVNAKSLSVTLRVQALSAINAILRSHLIRHRFRDSAVPGVKKIQKQLSAITESNDLPAELQLQLEEGVQMLEDLVFQRDLASSILNS